MSIGTINERFALFANAMDQWWIDVLDILIVAFIIYQLLQLIRGTHAVQVALGGAAFIGLYWVARWLNLQTVTWLVRTIMPYAVFGAIVIFQAEIRKVLAHVGKNPLLRYFSQHRAEEMIEEVVLTATTLSSRRVGAIIVIEREMGLRSYIETGIALDALLTYDLLMNVFTPGTPLHDGAVVIQGDRVAAAGCFLPLTVSPELSRVFGSRHRAAIGITEDTDAVAIVVSEETSIISIVVGGKPQRGLDGRALKAKMREALEVKHGLDGANGGAIAGKNDVNK
jgi:diadenylate cyclase